MLFFLAAVDRILYGTKNPFMAGNLELCDNFAYVTKNAFLLFCRQAVSSFRDFAHITKYAFFGRQYIAELTRHFA